MDSKLEIFISQGDFFQSISLNSILQFLFDEMIKAYCFSANIPLKCKSNSLT